jgi:hypothetical protein
MDSHQPLLSGERPRGMFEGRFFSLHYLINGGAESAPFKSVESFPQCAGDQL